MLDDVSALLLVGDAAALLSGLLGEARSDDSIRRYHGLGRLPAQRTASGVRLFHRADVERLARELATRRRRRPRRDVRGVLAAAMAAGARK